MHYCLLLITKEYPSDEIIDKKLSPYDENKKVPQYISMTKQDLINEAKRTLTFWKEKYEAYKKDPFSPENAKFNLTCYNYYKEYMQALEDNDEEKLYQQQASLYSEDELDKDGNVLSTYNPNSKWDWYKVGGRYSSFLDSCIGRISDWPKFEDLSIQELEKKYPDKIKEYVEIISGIKPSYYKLSYLKQRYPTFKEYMDDILSKVTYAVLDENEVWHEQTSASDYNKGIHIKKEIEWTRNFYSNFIKDKPKDYYITIIDYHI